MGKHMATRTSVTNTTQWSIHWFNMKVWTLRHRKIVLCLVPFNVLFVLQYVFSHAGNNLVSNQTVCQKKTKIGYMKIHKCASSSMQNILLRFAKNHHMNIVFPPNGYDFSVFSKYYRSMIKNTAWEKAKMKYDLFCCHCVWNKAEVESTLGPGAAYITMLRDPIQQFESMWSFFGMANFYNMDLETFALAKKTGKLSKRLHGYVGRNQMLWDLGMSEDKMDDPGAIRRMIKQVETEFDLVLIADMLVQLFT